MKIQKESGLSLQIFIPNIEKLLPFDYEFFTNSTVTKEKNMSISFDGTTYTNCKPCASGVYVYWDKTFSNSGKLWCRATYNVPSTLSESGFQRITQTIYTGIEIVNTGGEFFEPITNINTLTKPDFNDCSTTKVPVVMFIYPTGVQYYSNDYSLKGEQLSKGEFWTTITGETKQVYYQTFTGRMPSTITALEEIIQYGRFSQISVVTGSIGGFPPGWMILPEYYWTVRGTDNSLRIGIINLNTCKLGGEPYSFTIKYTK